MYQKSVSWLFITVFVWSIHNKYILSTSFLAIYDLWNDDGVMYCVPSISGNPDARCRRRTGPCHYRDTVGIWE